MMCRDLTLDDVSDIQNMNGNALDILAAVAGRAKEIFDDHLVALEKKRKAKALYFAGESSTSTPPKKPKCKPSPPPPPPPLPEEFHRKIREMARGKRLTSPPTFVMQKCLFETDLSPGHNRLLIPISRIRNEFLTAAEESYVCAHDVITKKKKYMKVRVIEPFLGVETVKFSRWDMAKKSNGGKTSSSYVINGKWSAIVNRNELRVNMEVQLWSFRVDHVLCFALVALPH